MIHQFLVGITACLRKSGIGHVRAEARVLVVEAAATPKVEETAVVEIVEAEGAPDDAATQAQIATVSPTQSRRSMRTVRFLFWNSLVS